MRALPSMRIPMRFTTLLFAVPLVALMAACGGGSDNATPAPGVPASILTATPYAKTPTPIIVSGTDTTGGGSGREITYKVESGDTLLALASKYDTTVEAIMKRNNLASATDLKAGQELIIPVGASTVAIATA